MNIDDEARKMLYEALLERCFVRPISEKEKKEWLNHGTE